MLDAIKQVLDNTGASYRFIDCDTDKSDTAIFCAHYGYALEDSVNTIVVKAKGGDGLGAVDKRLAALESNSGSQREMLGQVADMIKGVGQLVERYGASVEGQLTRIENQLKPPETDAEPQEPNRQQWETMFFGSDLLRSEKVERQRKELLDAALAGDTKGRIS